MLDGFRNGFDIGGRAGRGQRTFAGQFGKALALDEFQRNEMVPVGFANFVDGHDVRVPQGRNRLGFGFEPPHKIRTGKRAVQYNFQRHDAVQAQLPRPVHHAHAAARNFLQQFIVPQAEQAVRIRSLPFGKKPEPSQAFQAQAVSGVRRDAGAAGGTSLVKIHRD
jgi:hypothetical protein